MENKGYLNLFNFLQILLIFFSFDSPFANLARVLAGYFMQMFECHEPDKAALASTAFWKVMWPTFELQKDSITGVRFVFAIVILVYINVIIFKSSAGPNSFDKTTVS